VVVSTGVVLFAGSQVYNQHQHPHPTRSHRRISRPRDSGAWTSRCSDRTIVTTLDRDATYPRECGVADGGGSLPAIYSKSLLSLSFCQNDDQKNETKLVHQCMQHFGCIICKNRRSPGGGGNVRGVQNGRRKCPSGEKYRGEMSVPHGGDCLQ